MTTNSTIVMCMKCKHSFFSKAANPRCSRCGSTLIKNAEDVPKIYGGKDLQKLRIDFLEHKEYTSKVSGLLLDRIKALEAK